MLVKKHKTNTVYKPISLTRSEKWEILTRRVFLFLFISILISAMSFRICKAHLAGIVYDESFTDIHFEQDIYKSPTLDHPNFHVLTAIMNNWARKHFGAYEHYVRIPSVFFSLMFCLSTAYIIFSTIKSRSIRLALLLLVLFNPFTLNLSFLARGYSIALGGIALQFAFVVGLVEHKIKSGLRWIPILMLALTNFLVFGSMPSCVWILLGVNSVFILLYSHRVLVGSTKWLNAVIVNIISICIGSLVPLFLIYRRNFESILGAREDFGLKVSVPEFLRILFKDKVVNPEIDWSSAIYAVFVGIVVLSLLVFLCRQLKGINRHNRTGRINLDDGGMFFVLAALVTLAGYFVQRMVMGVSLGFPRNGVILIPLMYIAAGILIDRAWQGFGGKYFRGISRSLAATVVLLLALSNLPSAYAMNVYTWDFQSAAGPLLRKLRAIDPNRVWSIALTKKTWSFSLPLAYYRRFGYKYQTAGSQGYDVVVWHNKNEEVPKGIYMETDFFNKFNCTIGINTSSLPPDNVYMEVRVKEE